MKTIKIIAILMLISFKSFAQCYSTVVTADNTIIARKYDGTLWARGYNSNGVNRQQKVY